jgi:hypothetical protein
VRHQKSRPPMSGLGLKTGNARSENNLSAMHPNLLQNSQFAGQRIFCERTKREATADSYGLSRITEVASEFNARR